MPSPGAELALEVVAVAKGGARLRENVEGLCL